MYQIFCYIGIIVFAYTLLNYIIQIFYVQNSVIENLTSGNDTTIDVTNTNGESANSESYANTLTTKSSTLLNSLSLTQYKKNYENIILNLDEYLDVLMLKNVLNINLTDEQKTFESLNKLTILKNAKNTLNDVIKYVDIK